MRYLADTGILLRLFDRRDPQKALIRKAFSSLRQSGHVIVTTPQNLVEFWNVSTRPLSARGGYGLSLSVMRRRVAFIERLSPVLPESPAIHSEWKRIVETYGVSGAAVHDARIVAQMLVAGVTNIITLNFGDFRRYSSAGIVAETPDEIIAGAQTRP